jgi:hypothetical protein
LGIFEALTGARQQSVGYAGQGGNHRQDFFPFTDFSVNLLNDGGQAVFTV